MEGRGGEMEGGVEGAGTELLGKRTHRKWLPASERMDQTGKWVVEGSIPGPVGLELGRLTRWSSGPFFLFCRQERKKKCRFYGDSGKFEKPIEKYHSFAAISCSGLRSGVEIRA